MIGKVMNIQAVPSFLVSALHTDKVLVREAGRIITIEPAEEIAYNCPLLGAAAGSKLTVERFLEITRENNEDEAW